MAAAFTSRAFCAKLGEARITDKQKLSVAVIVINVFVDITHLWTNIDITAHDKSQIASRRKLILCYNDLDSLSSAHKITPCGVVLFSWTAKKYCSLLGVWCIIYTLIMQQIFDEVSRMKPNIFKQIRFNKKAANNTFYQSVPQLDAIYQKRIAWQHKSRIRKLNKLLSKMKT